MIVVTGAGGNVGSAVVKHLVMIGEKVRAADRNPRSDDTLTETAVLDFWDPSTFVPVLRGADRVFLLRPPPISRVGPTLNRFIDAASEEGVRHIVFSSVAGAESNRIVPHHRVESHLFESGLTWTILRPGFFSQNIATSYRSDIVESNRVYVPAGDGLAAFIDSRDIGEIAARALVEDGHAGKAYHLTGPEALSFSHVASILSDVLGRNIAYEPASIPGYFRHLLRQDLPLTHAAVQTILHAGLRKGDAKEVTDTVAKLLGRPPRSVRSYIDDHSEIWRVG